MRRLIVLLLCVLAGPSAGCEHAAPDGVSATDSPPQGERRAMLWKRIHGSTVVAVDNVDVRQALDAATMQARSTLDDARIRWTVADASARQLWAIKWAAERAGSPADDSASIEYVWVQPLAWSPFRIEGLLISHPTMPLECGRTAGELVSFPVEQVADWVHFASDAPDAAFEGGYTMRVLQERYGKPGA